MRIPELAALSPVALLVAATLQAQSPVTLSLGGAARLAAEKGALPEAARQRIAQADARVVQRKSEFLPNVTGGAGVNERTFNSASFGISFVNPATGKPTFDPNGEVLGPVKIWDARGTVRQSIYDPAAFARLRAARSGVTSAGSDASGVAQQAAAVAAGAYLRALRAESQLAARLADSVLAAELVRIARDQLNAGIGVSLDVTRAQAQAATVRGQVIAMRTERDRARIDLNRALSLPQGTEVTLSDSLFGLPTAVELPGEAAALARARTTRGDVRAIGEQVATAERQLDAIRAERFPALAAFADQGGSGKGVDHLLSTYTWGVQVSVPVFDGFRRDGRVDEQRAAIHELDLRKKDLEDQLAADIRAGLLELNAAREQLAVAQERFDLASQELAQARDRFSAGVAGNADVISASLGVSAARTQIVDARTALQAARIALAKAQGSVTELP